MHIFFMIVFIFLIMIPLLTTIEYTYKFIDFILKRKTIIYFMLISLAFCVILDYTNSRKHDKEPNRLNDFTPKIKIQRGRA
jgi:hypothetical protein